MTDSTVAPPAGPPPKSHLGLDSQPTIALIVVVSFIGLVLLWMIRPPSGDAASLSLLNALIMVVGTAFLTVVNNYFSSTRSNAVKDETIRSLTSGTGNGGNAAVIAAADAAAPSAAAKAAPAAAAVAAPPAADIAAPPAAEAAVAAALAERDRPKP